MAQQQKAARGGRKLKRGPKYKNHYSRNYDSVEENKNRRIERHELMVEESQSRHGGTTASERSYMRRHRVR